MARKSLPILVFLGIFMAAAARHAPAPAPAHHHHHHAPAPAPGHHHHHHAPAPAPGYHHHRHGPAPAPSPEHQVGGWKPIHDPKDPEVVAIGEFAINEHNAVAKPRLAFERVVSGEWQIAAGTNYRLVILARDGGASKKYRAVVSSKLWEKQLQLLSFDEEKTELL